MDSVEKGVKEVIAQNSRYAFDEIELTDPIDKFISSFMADRLARELKRKFSQVKTTELTNDLFTVLKRIQDIVTRINAYSN
ncbi:hypothetical protein [Aquimarina spongiae]|uniref:Uncharacterized protein n=1 Tax=Aquimarina spongiae TaxID=570521 RepID=A0A1M6AYN7_9FLAO|nr:hypothetical protein [Aquimarina spongiae]SHI41343.1 hypothetical protein SAMN04488508_101534 [Aquimarina spongiae]